MFNLTRNRRRERRLTDELLDQAATIRVLSKRCGSLTEESRKLRELAEQSVGFGVALREAVETASVSERDLRSLESVHGVTRPSRQPVHDPSEITSLWRGLPDPQ